jgi:hypothetical protein
MGTKRNNVVVRFYRKISYAGSTTELFLFVPNLFLPPLSLPWLAGSWRVTAATSWFAVADRNSMNNNERYDLSRQTLVELFATTCIKPHPTATTSVANAYDAFRSWSAKCSMSKIEFAKIMKKKGYLSSNSQGRKYVGYQLMSLRGTYDGKYLLEEIQTRLVGMASHTGGRRYGGAYQTLKA